MIVVLDTNIVFSTIANTNSKMTKVFFALPSKAVYYALDFLITELHQHHKKLLLFSGLSQSDYELSKMSVFSQINFVDTASIPEEYLKEAVKLTKNIDFKDFKFVALALLLDGLLWTGDRKLLYGLRRAGFMNVISTQEATLTFGIK
jgi:predicted nucleic acid-binding protein